MGHRFKIKTRACKMVRVCPLHCSLHSEASLSILVALVTSPHWYIFLKNCPHLLNMFFGNDPWSVLQSKSCWCKMTENWQRVNTAYHCTQLLCLVMGNSFCSQNRTLHMMAESPWLLKRVLYRCLQFEKLWKIKKYNKNSPVAHSYTQQHRCVHLAEVFLSSSRLNKLVIKLIIMMINMHGVISAKWCLSASGCMYLYNSTQYYPTVHLYLQYADPDQ